MNKGQTRLRGGRLEENNNATGKFLLLFFWMQAGQSRKIMGIDARSQCVCVCVYVASVGVLQCGKNLFHVFAGAEFKTSSYKLSGSS